MPLTPASAARAVGLAIFGAEPDPAQLEAMVTEIGEDGDALAALARRMWAYRQTIDRIEHRRLPDHSQNGEFALLLRELVAAGQRHGIIVDVGANGRKGSNSYDLLTDHGWKGLLVEANPALLPRIRDEFGAADFTLVGCAIGPEAGRLPLHLWAGDQISSLDGDNATLWGPARAIVEVEVRRLPDVLGEHGIPHDFDILSLDIEGLDVAVLNDLVATSPWRPRWIVIETPLPIAETSLAATALSTEVQALYELAGRTLPNLVLRLR